MCCCGAQLPPQFDAAASATASSLLYMYMMSCRPGLQLMMGLILLHPLAALAGCSCMPWHGARVLALGGLPAASPSRGRADRAGG